MANSIAYVLSKNTYPDAYQANLIGAEQGTQIVYATTSTLSSANKLYADSRLTQPIYGDGDDWYGVQLLTNDSVKYAISISDTGSVQPISNPTTTTTSTAAPATTTTTAASTTSTTASVPTTSTTTQGSLFFYPRFATFAGGIALRQYDIDPNVYIGVANSSGFRFYYSGTLQVGTQFYFDAAFTDPVVISNQAMGAVNTPNAYFVNTNDIYYTIVNGIVTEVLGAITIANTWNQFGDNPSLPSRVWTGTLVPCNEMNGSGFLLAPGFTSIVIGATVYSSINNLFSSHDYLSYNGIVNVLNGGSTILSQQSCT